MDARDFVRLVRRHWKLVLVSTLLGLGAAVGVTRASTPMYQTSVETFVSLRDSSGASSAYQDNLFSQARVKSYAKIVDSPSVTRSVVHDLKLAISPQRLADRITASVPADTVLVDITVRDSSPSRARDVADAVGARFAAVVADLEAPGPDQPSPVSVTVVRPATLPRSPVTPRVPLNLGLGLVAGAGVGLGLAALRNALDTSVKTREEVQELTGGGVLAVVGFDRQARTSPLITQLDPCSPRSEAFRGLRTNLRFVDVDAPPKVVVVTSSVSAEGKSTTTCNLGLTMAKAGIRTIVVEADLRGPSVADYMGLEGAVGLTDVLSGGARLEDVLQPWGDLPLEVLASGELPPNPGELLCSAQMADLLARLRARADFVLLDTPPLVPVIDAAPLARECDGAILVVRYGRVDRDLVRRAKGALDGVGARLLGTVLTMTPVKAGQGYYTRSRTYHRTGTPVEPAVPGAVAGTVPGGAQSAGAPVASGPTSTTSG